MAFNLRRQRDDSTYDAIVRAAESLAQRQEQRKAIVVLSDGMDTRARPRQEKHWTQPGGERRYICSRHVGLMKARHRRTSSALVLKSFAEKSGGRFIALREDRRFATLLPALLRTRDHHTQLPFAQQTRRATDVGAP